MKKWIMKGWKITQVSNLQWVAVFRQITISRHSYYRCCDLISQEILSADDYVNMDRNWRSYI